MWRTMVDPKQLTVPTGLTGHMHVCVQRLSTSGQLQYQSGEPSANYLTFARTYGSTGALTQQMGIAQVLRDAGVAGRGGRQ